MDPADVGSSDIQDISALIEKLRASMEAEEVRDAVRRAMRDWQEKLAKNYALVGEMRPISDGPALPPPVPMFKGFGHGDMPQHQEPSSTDQSLREELGPQPMEIICRKPRIHLHRNFLSHSECRRIISMIVKRQEGMRFDRKARSPLALHDPIWSDEELSFIKNLEERVVGITGGPDHKDEVPLVGMLTPGGTAAGISDHLGLHVDTNAAEWRYTTAIIYLSSVVSGGGETVFPAAVGDGFPSEEEERAVEAAGTLLELGIDHTDRTRNGRGCDAAQELLQAAAEGTGLRVTPEEGMACVFWTRQDDGEIDRHSWHGGAPIPQGNSEWKWTLQKFKEVPAEVRSDPAALSNFVRRSRFITLPR